MQHRLGRNVVRMPVVTFAITVLTATVSVVAIRHPRMLSFLERHPEAWQPDTFWHFFTPLLVHDRWLSLALNLVGLLVVGAAVEREVGAARWCMLYLSGGIVGEFLGMIWQPTGAGNSVATCGHSCGRDRTCHGNSDRRRATVRAPRHPRASTHPGNAGRCSME
jgi:membrane associated rhomboid family serine protease